MSVDASGTTMHPETAGGSVAWFKPGIPSPAWRNEKDMYGIVINTEENATVNGHLVPKLTVDQIVEAYNSIVLGKQVIITDANGYFHLAVIQADSINDEIAIIAMYFDSMILTYHDDGTISYKEI